MAEGPKNILHILGTAQREGSAIARIVANIASGVDPQKYRVHAWFLGPSGPLVDELSAAGAAVRVVDWQAGIRDPVGALRFLRYMWEQEFALVHQHSGARSVRHLISISSRARLVIHLHGIISRPLSDRELPIEVRGADAVIAVSQAVARQIRMITPTVVYSGVRASEPLDCKGRGDATTIGTACRLDPLKGVVYLIWAAIPLFLEFPHLRLEIAGDGDQRGILEAEVRRLGLTDRISFLGWKTDLGETFRTWDIFALPSLTEGYGLVVLEAMAAGLPVVGTSVGGLPELIEDGHTGYVVSPAVVSELTARLRDLIHDEELRRAFGAKGRARAESLFSVETMVDQIVAIYDDLVRE